jgi:hypothetical protein
MPRRLAGTGARLAHAPEGVIAGGHVNRRLLKAPSIEGLVVAAYDGLPAGPFGAT